MPTQRRTNENFTADRKRNLCVGCTARTQTRIPSLSFQPTRNYFVRMRLRGAIAPLHNLPVVRKILGQAFVK